MESDSISQFFGLSYNSYLVVPRSLIGSMPQEWKDQLSGLLDRMLDTPGGQRFVEHHYWVQRTDPGTDAEIHDADIHNQTCRAGDERPVRDPLVLDDPFRNYRHPDQTLFAEPPHAH